MTARGSGHAGPASELLAKAGAALAAERREEAIGHLRAAAEAAPDDAAIHHDLGYLHLASGHFSEAARSFRQALAADDNFALAAVRLGVALQALDDVDGALGAYRHAAACAPSRADAPFREGALLELLGRRTAALASFGRAAATRPGTALSLLAAVRLDLAHGRLEPAERGLRALLDVHPAHLEATDTLGELLADTGRLDEAWDCYARVTATSPHYAGSFYDLVRCRQIRPDDGDLVGRMATAAARTDLHAEARARLHLALGKAADDLDDPARAMAHFDEADRIRGRSGEPVAQLIEERVERLIGRFDAGALAAAAATRTSAGGDGDPAPILIVGLPRSGTTLVEQVLSCHPAVVGGGELPFWTERAADLTDPVGDEAFRARAASDYLDVLRAIGRPEPGATSRDAASVTDKMPLNVFHAGLVHLALPRAVIVLCRRRPIDVALSIHRTSFNRHLAFPTGGDALVRTVRAVERLLLHWRAMLPPASIHEVRYEELVSEPERAIRALVAACGLSWDERCLRPERNPRMVRTPSKWQVRRPIAAPPPEAWRRFEPWLGPLAALL